MGISMENDTQPWSYQKSLKCYFFSENSEDFSSPKIQVPVDPSVSQKHLGLHLDQKSDFSKHNNEKISKAQPGILVI